MLAALGLRIRHYHMNEGHSALLTLELLRRTALPERDVRAGGLYDIPRDDAVWDAHGQAKSALLAEIATLGVHLDPARPIISFARRMTAYKRPDVLFADLEGLRAPAR